jgi:hypothetical protein
MSDDPLLSLDEAAKLLGYSPSGLRKIVNRTKAGKQDAAIQFFQVGKGPIKFRREWIDDFIAANSVIPRQPRPRVEPQHLRLSG